MKFGNGKVSVVTVIQDKNAFKEKRFACAQACYFDR